jgi:hypothetical protein
MRSLCTLGLATLLVLASTGLPAAKHHAHAKAAPAAPAAPTPEATPQPTPVVFVIHLKDRQSAKLTLLSYDRFFVSASNAKGTRFDIPWVEIAGVDSLDPGLDAEMALMRGNITPERAAVSSVVEPRIPGTALKRALLWPGIIVHGSGYRYAGDNDAFVSLAGAEFFGLLVGAFGGYLQAYPDGSDTTKSVPQDLVAAGVTIFAVTWIVDIAFSPSAARSLDEQKGLALEPLPQGAQLAYHF